MSTSMGWCVACNEIWPWPISWMSLSHDYAARISHIMWSMFYSTRSSGWVRPVIGINDHWHEKVCRVQWTLTLTNIFKIIRPWFAIKLPEYGTSCRLRSTACPVLDGFFPHFAYKIISMRRCVVPTGHEDFCSGVGGILLDHLSTIYSSIYCLIV